jgi:hypothetical protein
MHKVVSSFGAAATLGALMLVGVSGCSMFANPIPVDCNIVKTQQEAGKTDSQIASDLGAKESEVAACRGPIKGGNKTTGSTIPENY